jgi:hypothetical protein
MGIRYGLRLLLVASPGPSLARRVGTPTWCA